MLLPPGAAINAAGRLTSAGHDLVALAERHGTPLYIWNEDVIRERCRAYRAAFAGYEPGASVAYAAKALWNLAMARVCDQEDLDLDVVSAGELHTALVAGFPPTRIHFHGNNKGRDEIELGLSCGIGYFVLDNFQELAWVDEVARALGRRQQVLLRVAPGIDAHTHSYIQTGSQDSKFGFDLATGQALDAARRAAAAEGLELVGLHSHVASQMFDVAAYRVCVEKLLDLAVAIRSATDVPIRHLNVGGGPGARYVDEDRPFTPTDLGRATIEAVRAGCAARDLPEPVIGIEPGRSIVAEAGIALYTVGTEKRVPGLIPYVAVDGGMGDNIRPALYGAEYTVVVANRMHDPVEERVHVVGRYCESGDFLAKGVTLPRTRPGDTLAFFTAGAYQFPMSSNYNRVPRPAGLLVRAAGVDLIIERESLDDLVRQDRVPDRLRAI